jgi:large subunit ribosomal protein L24
MLIKKGMQVRVISGAHKGSEGKVLFVSPKQHRVVVEGVNFIKKSTRPSQENQSGGIVEKEAPLHISNVMLLQSGNVSRLGYKILDDGSKVRVLKKTNEESEIQ